MHVLNTTDTYMYLMSVSDDNDKNMIVLRYDVFKVFLPFLALLRPCRVVNGFESLIKT